MKEIDFIPNWYRIGRQRRRTYRRQYMLLGGLFGLLLVGCLGLGVSISRGRAFVERTRDAESTYGVIRERFEAVQRQVTELEAKQRMLETLDPQVAWSAVVAEVSHVVPSNIVLERLEITAESVSGPGSGPAKVGTPKVVLSASAVGAAAPAADAMPESQERFRVRIKGVAADAGQVSRLVSNLEQSDYFRQISPGLIRNKRLAGRECIEFEVACYLANVAEDEGA